MTAAEIESIVEALAAKHFKKAAVDLDLPLDELSDSLQLTELMLALEQRFDITLPDASMIRVRTLRDLIALVQSARASR